MKTITACVVAFIDCIVVVTSKQSIVIGKITIFNGDPVFNGRWIYLKGKA